MTVSSPSETRQLTRLRRALSTSTNDLDREQHAFAIADLSTPAAYAALLSEVVNRTRAKEACAAALREAGPSTLPLTTDALSRDPDNPYLVLALPLPVSEETADLLIETCKRTTTSWVGRMSAEVLARSRSKRVADLREVVIKRDSDVFAAALHCGLVASGRRGDASGLKRYLLPEVPAEVRDLALSVGAVRQLPEAKQLIRQMALRGKIGDRSHALRLIAADQAGEFAELVLDVWFDDKSPNVRYHATHTLCVLGPEVGPIACARLRDACENLKRQANRLTSVLREHSLTATAPVREALADLRRMFGLVRQLWLAGLLIEGATAVAPEMVMTLRYVVPHVVGAGFAANTLKTELLDLSEKLIEAQIGVLRHLWLNGRPEIRAQALEALGFTVAALSPVSPRTTRRPSPVPWETALATLAACTEQIAYAWVVRIHRVHTSDDAGAWPFSALTALRAQVADLVMNVQRGPQLLSQVQEALAQSLLREREAVRPVVATHDATRLFVLQDEFNEQPLVLLSLEYTHYAEFIRQHPSSSGDQGLDEVEAVLPVFAEQTLQVALLAIAAVHLTARATPILIDYLESDNALVAECAETLLVRVGAKALTRLQMAIPRCVTSVQRARLLEACRCIDAGAAVGLAREYLTADDGLVRAVCLRILGEAGSTSDVPAVQTALGEADELGQVCALFALGELALEASVPDLVLHLSHPSAAVRFAAHDALQRCQAETKRRLATSLSEDADGFRRLYGEEVLSSSREDNPRSIGFHGKPASIYGDHVLGARMAVAGELPWQWGVNGLLGPEHVPWQLCWPAVASDEELARDWAQYSIEGEFPPGLLKRLADLTRGADDPILAEQARTALSVLLGDAVEPIVESTAAYYRVTSDDVRDAFPKASASALKECLDGAVDGLAMPNPSAANPLGEGVLMEHVNDSLAFATAFALLLKKTLPEALHVARPPELDSDDPATRLQAVSEEWAHVAQFADFLHGLWVEPLVTPPDIVWYCAQPSAEPATKYGMINYLAASATLAVQLPQARQTMVEALQLIFRPLLRKTASRVASIQSSPVREVVPLVEEAFWAAVEDFDSLRKWSPGSFLPLGTLADMGKTPDGTADTYRGQRPYMPFPLFVERRMADVIRRGKQRVAQEKRTVNTPTEDLEEAGSSEAVVRWREYQEAVLNWILSPESERGSLPIPTALYQFSIPSHDVPVDGETLRCVDLATLGGILDTEVRTLYKRHERGRLRCVKHEGKLYFPVDDIPDQVASALSDRDLGKMLDKHRNTIGEWRGDAECGLPPREVLRYIWRRAGRE